MPAGLKYLVYLIQSYRYLVVADSRTALLLCLCDSLGRVTFDMVLLSHLHTGSFQSDLSSFLYIAGIEDRDYFTSIQGDVFIALQLERCWSYAVGQTGSIRQMLMLSVCPQFFFTYMPLSRKICGYLMLSCTTRDFFFKWICKTCLLYMHMHFSEFIILNTYLFDKCLLGHNICLHHTVIEVSSGRGQSGSIALMFVQQRR